MNEKRTGFGPILRRMRKERNLSQMEAVAQFKKAFPDAGVSQAAWSAWEARHYALSGEALEKLASFFGVHPRDFFD